MKSYNLIDGLFSKKTGTAGAASGETPVLTTKRTFKIANEHWQDFVDLAAARKMTQAELINALIETVVRENTEEIEKYRDYFKK